MDDLKKTGIEDSTRTPRHRGKTLTACLRSHTQPPTHPLPARQGPPRTPGSPPSDGLRPGGTWRPCRPLASLPAPRSQALLTVSHSSAASPAGREAEPKLPASVTLLDVLPSMPSRPPPSRARKGGENHPPARSSRGKPTLALGAPPWTKGQ